MGAGVEMTRRTKAFVSLACLLLVAACGTDPVARETLSHLPKGRALAALVSGLFYKPKPTAVDPAAVATLRSALEKAGQPVLLVKVPQLRYANLFAPYGQNGDVITWASSSYQTIALQDGILLATRGFGTDLMSAKGPTLAQIRRGSGTFQREYFDLDGADQNRHFSYTCTLAKAGAEEVEVFGARYATRKVVESCVGPDLSFENAFWFDADGSLRLSDQHAGPGLAVMQIGRILNPSP